MSREKSGTEAAVSDAPENANEEFGRSDQEFGGGAGDVEYGEQSLAVGVDGTVAEPGVLPPVDVVMDDEKEGVVLPGSDDSDDE
ncbi:MAG: hypothetical protein AABY18_00140 [Candidatus Thermoplasmatota archaeon]